MIALAAQPSAHGHAHRRGSITDVGVDLPTLGEIIDVMTLQAGHNAAVVVAGTTMLGIAAGVVGVFALLRRRSLMGDALAHATLPGVAGAFLVAMWIGLDARSMPLLLAGAAVAGVIGAACVQGIVRFSRIREDAAIGIVLSVFFGLGVVLLSYIQRLDGGAQGGLSRFIFGQTAAMSRENALLMAGVAACAVLAALVLFKQFRLVCFDADYARSLGWSVGGIDLLMMGLVVLVTVAGLQAVGMLLVVALLIIPPAAARFWTDRLWLMTAVSAAIGGLSGHIGASASSLLPRLPTGAVIVLAAGVIFALSMVFAPARGLAPRALRHLRLRAQVSREHALRALYELAEPQGIDEYGAAVGDVWRARQWSEGSARSALRGLRRRGLVRTRNGDVALTERGAEAARRVTRNHRLWEEYLVRYADVAPSHVDRSADMVEHALSPELIVELETALREEGRLPKSVHPLQAPGDTDASGEDER